jgi:hypothetical protein
MSTTVETKQVKAADSTGAFVATVLNAATVAHILHLQTRSFSQHKTLDELYNALPEHGDELVEAYQGKYQTIIEYPVQSVKTPGNALDFVVALKDYVKANRYTAFSQEDSEIQNIIDELAGTLDSTIYKLTFLS